MSELKEITILCEVCKGTKTVIKERRCECVRLTPHLWWWYYLAEPDCTECHGSGKKKYRPPCHNCKGHGICTIWVED